MSKRILVIDDEENIRRVTRLTLRAAGYEVGEAGDGERGLDPSSLFTQSKKGPVERWTLHVVICKRLKQKLQSAVQKKIRTAGRRDFS